QSELKELLAAPSLRQLNERILVRYDLKPLDSGDIQGYVEHRLVVAGGRGNVRFTNGVFRKIYAYSQGNPRRINAVCDRALLIAYVKEKHAVSKGIVGKAIEELHGDMRIEPVVSDWSWKRVALSTLLLLLLIMVAGFAGWSLREHIFRISPVEQKIAPSKIVKPIHTPPGEIEPKKEPSALFLDEKMSLTGLFDLFSRATEKNQDLNEAPFSLVSFNVEPKYSMMFKKPFRVHLSDPVSTPLAGPHYLLIREVTEEGAIAVDAEGKERPVTRDFILKHWGAKLSWFYPHKNKDLYLKKGMDVPDVLAVQRTLNEIGYGVEPTGVYDDPTFQGVKKFQRDLGLKADGIAGPRTRALLFQMSN
ncbi:MAG: peptidoglycan-binding protein, partial [Deltaproteobacteria bacterium]